jgi:PAB-dependent poly(A)-specific ribonuclease subunit 2
MIQGLTRFLLDRISNDYRSIPPASTTLEQTLFNLPQPINQEDLLSRLLATSAVTSIRCNNCRNESTRPGSTYVNDLVYPPPSKPGGPRGAGAGGGRAIRTTFSQVLKTSIERETTSKGWCSRCQRYQTLQTRKTIHNIPAVLTLNAAVGNQEHRRLWATPGWLPEEIGVIVDRAGQFFCYEGEDLKLHLQRGIHSVSVYSLVGVVVNVEGGEAGAKEHLVGMVNGEFLFYFDMCSVCVPFVLLNVLSLDCMLSGYLLLALGSSPVFVWIPFLFDAAISLMIPSRPTVAALGVILLSRVVLVG